ncbi:MAG: hypothetical protein A2X20_00300 [Bacteroidetes bacterium GWE2_40_15]|nr:MAG: hypothetical protein A2X20_00300 [Bacteroidetes bacterium GWE2_40_15]
MNIENLNLEKFSGMGSKVSRKISITKSYSFGIPPVFFKENNLEQYNYVAVFYDKTANVIAFKFEKEDVGEVFKLVKYGSGTRRGASFVARSFFNTYGIDPVKYKGKYEANKGEKEDIGEIYWIELGEPKPKE